MHTRHRITHTALCAMRPTSRRVPSMTYRADGQLLSLSSGGVKDSWMFDANQARVCHREQPTSTLDTAPCGTPTQTNVTDTTDHGVVEGAVDYNITNTTTSHTLTWHHHSITHGTTAQLTTTNHTWWLSDLYGNLVTQHTIGGVQGAEPVIDENGNTTNTNTYTWAATHTKTRHHTGLITLTHRTYNPQTHQFLQPDPILGGTPNPYTYPTDPINHQDYCGLKCTRKDREIIQATYQLLGTPGGWYNPFKYMALKSDFDLASEDFRANRREATAERVTAGISGLIAEFSRKVGSGIRAYFGYAFPIAQSLKTLWGNSPRKVDQAFTNCPATKQPNYRITFTGTSITWSAK